MRGCPVEKYQFYFLWITLLYTHIPYINSIKKFRLTCENRFKIQNNKPKHKFVTLPVCGGGILALIWYPICFKRMQNGKVMDTWMIGREF